MSREPGANSITKTAYQAGAGKKPVKRFAKNSLNPILPKQLPQRQQVAQGDKIEVPGSKQ